MTQHRKILNFLLELRSSHSTMEQIYLYGSCMNLFCILRILYPQAVPYYNIDHVITKIDDYYYDITGKVSPKGYLPFNEFYNKHRTSRAFTQMYNYENK